MKQAIPDEEFMARALRLAGNGLYSARPNPRVGCVLTRQGAVVGEGWHEYAGQAHAEIAALQSAGEQARGATAYVTLEPCAHQGKTPPCADALIAAGVAKVVVAMQDPNPLVSGQGSARLEAAGIDVKGGVLQAQAEALNPGFIKRMTCGLPYVRLKMATSLDGRTAMASGESKWITGAAARADVQRLRARSCAVLTGIGTVLGDDPSLTVREPQPGLENAPAVAQQQPLRVVLDSGFRTPLTAKLLELDGDALVIGATDVPAMHALKSAGAQTAVLPAQTAGNARVDLAAALRLLGERQCNEVLVEAGATLGGALLQAGLVDELVIYQAPMILGHEARPLLALPGLERLSQRLQLDIKEVRSVGTDLRINAIVTPLSSGQPKS
jgi:diaminohydroxyphosphoribosylaminopyrimidine deaminase/5-amino-6-(5-phosphoribosylamino)uracil reductase